MLDVEAIVASAHPFSCQGSAKPTDVDRHEQFTSYQGNSRPTASGAVIDRASVVAVAIEVIDECGLQKMTIRGISGRLRVRPTALARVFSSRDDLLETIVGTLVHEMFDYSNIQPASASWQEYLRRVAAAVRQTALTHPEIFPLVATRTSALPWLQAPLRNLAWLEAFMETLHQFSFSNQAAVASYRTFSSFLLGHLLSEVSVVNAHGGPNPYACGLSIA